MPRSGRNSQRRQQARDLEGVQVPTAEEEEDSTPSYSGLIQVTIRQMLAGGIPCFTQIGSSSPAIMVALLVGQQVSFSHQEDVEGAEHLEENAINVKVADLVLFLLLKYEMKEPFTKVEILESIIGNDEHDAEIFTLAIKNARLIFGIDVTVLDPAGSSYALVTALGLTYDGMQSDVQGKPKTGLLIIALGTIVFNDNPVPEEMMWNMLSLLGICATEDHYITGNPNKLITEEFVQEGYLQYQKVPDSYPAQYEFLWGPRAYAETSMYKVMQFLRNIGEPVPF